MPQKLYTQGEAISLAGKILARIVELMGMVFLLLIKFFSFLCRGIFAGAGIFVDGYNTIRNGGHNRINPELKLQLEETVLLASGEAQAGWQWLDEAMLPVKQILASTQTAFIEKTMKRRDIIVKDHEAVVMAGILKKIVFETVLATANCQPLDCFMGEEPAGSIKQRAKRKITRDIKSELVKYLASLRFVTSRCPDDPARKAALLLNYSRITLKYHRTGRIKFREKMHEIGNSLVESKEARYV